MGTVYCERPFEGVYIGVVREYLENVLNDKSYFGTNETVVGSFLVVGGLFTGRDFLRRSKVIRVERQGVSGSGLCIGDGEGSG